jgi:hypothetical protein
MINNEKRRIINNIDHDDTTIWRKYGIDNEARNNTAAAEIYEQHLVPAMFEPFARHLIQLCNIRRSDRILDIACGTGIVSRLDKLLNRARSELSQLVDEYNGKLSFSLSTRLVFATNNS